MGVRPTTQRAEYAELAGLYFLQAMATAMWFVPCGVVLDACGLGKIKALAFATTATAALISPLIFGSMADRHVSPIKVLRWLSVASAVTMVFVTLGIQHHLNAWLVLALIQLQALFSTPTASITIAIVFSRLRDARTDFGPIRAMATFGWMTGCWVISALNADASVLAGYSDAVMWLVLVASTFFLPEVPPPKTDGPLTLRQRLGWDALGLLKDHDHRVVFITMALFYIPISAFYPFAPTQLRELGLHRTSAWLTLGQVTEIMAMFSLAWLLSRWRLKWIIGTGLAVALLRFVLFALNQTVPVFAAIMLHGVSLVMVLVTAQVYVDQRVDASWRVRAQSLLYLGTNGIGSLLGFVGAGWWFQAASRPAGPQWHLFWGGLAAVMGIILVYFLIAYRGIGSGLKRAK